jgi:hypothetical protein
LTINNPFLLLEIFGKMGYFEEGTIGQATQHFFMERGTVEDEFGTR